MTHLKDDALREYALRALADDTRVAADVPAEPFVAALNDPNPRVRLQAVDGSWAPRQNRRSRGVVSARRGQRLHRGSRHGAVAPLAEGFGRLLPRAGFRG